MPYSVIINGTVYDIKYIKRPVDTLVKLNKKSLGTLYNHGKSGWTAIVINGRIGYPICIEGFISRTKAMEYLLKAHGLHK